MRRRRIHSGAVPLTSPLTLAAKKAGQPSVIFGAHVGAGAPDPSTGAIGQRLRGAEPRRDEIERDAARAHAIGPVGQHVDVDHRIVEPGIIGIGHADRRIRRHFDDPVMLLADLEFACRAHHAVRFDAADRRDLQHHCVRGHDRACGSEYAEHARAGIGRAADDLQRAVTGIDRKHLQLVGLRVRRGAEHARDLERGERGTGVFDPFHFQPDAGERLDNGVERGVGFDMLFQPTEGCFHWIESVTPAQAGVFMGLAVRALTGRPQPTLG